MAVLQTRRSSSLRRTSLVAAPVVLLITMYLVFDGFVALFGPQLGLFLGMLVYWLGWCLAFPWWAVGPEDLQAAFRDVRPRVSKPSWLGWTLLALPVIVAVIVGYTEAWSGVTLVVALLSVPFALVNGTFEEILWRGTYVRAFPGRLTLGYLYPAFGFAVWHLAPVSAQAGVYTLPGVGVGIVGALVFGLCWGWPGAPARFAGR